MSAISNGLILAKTQEEHLGALYSQVQDFVTSADDWELMACKAESIYDRFPRCYACRRARGGGFLFEKKNDSALVRFFHDNCVKVIQNLTQQEIKQYARVYRQMLNMKNSPVILYFKNDVLDIVLKSRLVVIEQEEKEKYRLLMRGGTYKYKRCDYNPKDDEFVLNVQQRIYEQFTLGTQLKVHEPVAVVSERLMKGLLQNSPLSEFENLVTQSQQEETFRSDRLLRRADIQEELVQNSLGEDPFHMEEWKVCAIKIHQINIKFPSCHECQSVNKQGFLFENKNNRFIERFYDVSCAKSLQGFDFDAFHDILLDLFFAYTDSRLLSRKFQAVLSTKTENGEIVQQDQRNWLDLLRLSPKV